MRTRSVDCEVGLTTAACVRKAVTHLWYAARSSLALFGPFIADIRGDEVIRESQR